MQRNRCLVLECKCAAATTKRRRHQLIWFRVVGRSGFFAVSVNLTYLAAAAAAAAQVSEMRLLSQ